MRLERRKALTLGSASRTWSSGKPLAGPGCMSWQRVSGCPNWETTPSDRDEAGDARKCGEQAGPGGGAEASRRLFQVQIRMLLANGRKQACAGLVLGEAERACDGVLDVASGAIELAADEKKAFGLLVPGSAPSSFYMDWYGPDEGTSQVWGKPFQGGFGLGPNFLALTTMRSGIYPLSLGSAQRGGPPCKRTVPGGFCKDGGEGEGCGDPIGLLRVGQGYTIFQHRGVARQQGSLPLSPGGLGIWQDTSAPLLGRSWGRAPVRPPHRGEKEDTELLTWADRGGDWV